MPLDVNCPKCEKVFAVTEARHPVGVQCPGCDTELTAEFRRVPVPNPGESPYELLVSPGRPEAVPPPLSGGKKPMPLDDDERGHGGGSMTMVVVVGLTALVLTLGGLSVTGYVLFTNLDTTPSTYRAGNTGGTTGGNKGTKGNKGGGSPGGGIIPGGGDPFEGFIPGGGVPGGGFPDPPVPKKVDRFSLKPITGPLPKFTETRFDASGASVITLPGKADAIAVGGAGRYVAMHIADKGLLAVVDVCEGKVVAQKEADTGNVKLAAGLNKLVMLAPAAGLFRVYNLPNLEKISDAKIASSHWVQMIGMGNRTDGPLMAVNPFGEVLLHDISKPDAPVIEGSQGGGGHAGHGEGLRVSPDGKTFATFDGFGRDHKVILLTESGGKWTATKDTHPMPFPNAAGDLFYGNGAAMDRGGKIVNIGGIGLGSGHWFVPATSGNYFLKIVTVAADSSPFAKKSFTVTVHTDRKGDTPVAGIAPIANIETEGLFDVWGSPNALDQHLILVPEAKVLVFIPGSKDRVHFRRMELR